MRCAIVLMMVVVVAFAAEQDGCSLFGGKCMSSMDCSLRQGTDLSSQVGCEQTGTICCNTVPREHQCKAKGGECTSVKCPKNLQAENKDCAPGLNCCVYV